MFAHNSLLTLNRSSSPFKITSLGIIAHFSLVDHLTSWNITPSDGVSGFNISIPSAFTQSSVSVADKIIVLRKGVIIEESSSENIFNNPQSEYTKNLIKAVL